jgi:hypothetical protein
MILASLVEQIPLEEANVASEKQVLQLIQLGFEKVYAESLPSDHAKKLLSQLFGICRTYYADNRIDLRSDIEQAVELKKERYGRKLAPAIVHQIVESLAGVAK